MTSEKTRLEFLHRMGIRSYVPKRQLPGALASIRLVPSDGSAFPAIEAHGANTDSAKVSSASKVEHGIQSLASVKALLAKPAINDLKTANAQAAQTDATPQSGSYEQSTPANGVSHKPTDQNTDQSKHLNNTASHQQNLPGASAVQDAIDAPEQPVHLVVFQYQSLCVVSALGEAQGIYSLDPVHRVLIGDAIRLTLGDYDANQLREQELHWPLLGKNAPKRGTAHEFLSGFFDAQSPELLIDFGGVVQSIVLGAKRLQAETLNELVGDASKRTQLADQLIRFQP
ncbi:MAG: hypothetical protein HWD83_06320 [Gammaproteobacteria bacterium]|nr:hypothetical protein [Gammaproteobacteria bacterium]